MYVKIVIKEKKLVGHRSSFLVVEIKLETE